MKKLAIMLLSVVLVLSMLFVSGCNDSADSTSADSDSFTSESRVSDSETASETGSEETSDSTSESESTHIPFETAKLIVGDNTVELYVEDGREATFKAATAGRYEIGLKEETETVTFKIKTSGGNEDVNLPYNAFFEAEQEITLVLASVATEEKDSVIITVKEDKNNYVASVDIKNKICPDDGKMSFITAEAYSNITEISFKAKTGTEASWWGISLATDDSTASLYNMPLGTLPATNGEWALFTYKFENGVCKITSTIGYSATKEIANEDYYVYVIGARSENFNENVMFDDFTIVADGETYVDDFQKGLNNGLFVIDDVWNEGGAPVSEVIVNDIEISDKNNYVASIDIKNKLCPDDGKMSFITLEAYSNITEISFKAKTGTEASWWGISLAADASTASIYSMPLGTLPATNGKWALFTYKFENGVCKLTSTIGYSLTKEVANADYYIYIIGARGENFDENVMFDDFTIIADGETYVEDFQKDSSEWIFDADTELNNGSAPVAKVVANGIEIKDNTNFVASIDVKNRLCPDDGKMSFITAEAYSNITEISFRAKTGTEASWWGISLATDASKASIYNMPLGTLAKTDGEWVTFTFTFADGKCTIKSSASEDTVEKDVANADYYIYFIGARGENFNANIMIDDFKIIADGVTYIEDFQKDPSEWLFEADVTENNGIAPVAKVADGVLDN